MKKFIFLVLLMLFVQLSAFSRTYFVVRLAMDADKDGVAEKTTGAAFENRAEYDAYVNKKIAEGWVICFQEEVDLSSEDQSAKGINLLGAVGCGPIDCAPGDAARWRKVKLWVDEDQDGHATGTVTLCIGDSPPPGHSETELPIGDCAPADPARWRMACVSTPIPGKPKQWTNSKMCVGNTPPPGSWFCTDGPPPTPELIFTVYPNPVADRLNIISAANWNERAEIKLVNQYARVVRTLVVPNAVKGQTFSINTTDLKPGLYQLTIRRGEMVESRTIAVKL
jgi:Secretion system C-terminal sorting domain